MKAGSTPAAPLATHLPHRFNACSAAALLQPVLPEVKEWVVWLMDPEKTGTKEALRRFTGDGVRTSGTIGPWHWRKVDGPYSNLHFWSGESATGPRGECWTGLIEITGEGCAPFHLFSYPDHENIIGREYLASTPDLDVLQRFADDAARILHSSSSAHEIRVEVLGDPDVVLDSREEERLYLEPGLLADVEAQVHAFFKGADLYRRLGAPHRRGFLFTGSPGNGKTLLVRHLLRLTHRLYQPVFRCMSIRSDLASEHLALFFSRPVKDRPMVLILEELDSLMCETKVTRAQLLSRLDGLDNRGGALVIATTNHPGRIDAALLHRPSRFDRVWSLPVPADPMRRQYLCDAFPSISEGLLAELVARTRDWSFAYLKELRISAAVAAAHVEVDPIPEELIRQAHRHLAAQFKAGEKLHAVPERTGSGLGFAPAEDLELEVCSPSRTSP